MTFSHLGLGMRNGPAFSKFLGLGRGIQNIIQEFWDWEWELKIKLSTFGIGNGNENIIPNFWEWEIAYYFPKSWECNWKL